VRERFIYGGHLKKEIGELDFYSSTELFWRERACQDFGPATTEAAKGFPCGGAIRA
jgi:hypothetical protein